VPFRLATAELFERYVEACLRFALRTRQDHAMWVGYHDNNVGKKFAIRPDFLVRAGDERLVLDAKYKDLIRQSPRGSNGEESRFRQDSYQVLSYSQHRCVQSWWSNQGLLPPSGTVLCYPMCLRIARQEGQQDPDNNVGALITEVARGAAKLASGSEVIARSDMRSVIFNDFVLPVIQLGLAVPLQPGAVTL